MSVLNYTEQRVTRIFSSNGWKVKTHIDNLTLFFSLDPRANWLRCGWCLSRTLWAPTKTCFPSWVLLRHDSSHPSTSSLSSPAYNLSSQPGKRSVSKKYPYRVDKIWLRDIIEYVTYNIKIVKYFVTFMDTVLHIYKNNAFMFACKNWQYNINERLPPYIVLLLLLNLFSCPMCNATL